MVKKNQKQDFHNKNHSTYLSSLLKLENCFDTQHLFVMRTQMAVPALRWSFKKKVEDKSYSRICIFRYPYVYQIIALFFYSAETADTSVGYFGATQLWLYPWYYNESENIVAFISVYTSGNLT